MGSSVSVEEISPHRVVRVREFTSANGDFNSLSSPTPASTYAASPAATTGAHQGVLMFLYGVRVRGIMLPRARRRVDGY